MNPLRPRPALAQAPCSFVLGFAEFVSQSGDLVGGCAEQQRTLSTEDRVTVPGHGPMVLQPGETVQATTHGLLTWNEQRATVEFLGRDGVWHIGESGLVLTRWEAAPPQSEAPSADASIPEPLRPAWDALMGSGVMVTDGEDTVPIGARMQETVAATGVTLRVGPLRPTVAGQYQVSDNTLTVNSAVIGEDRRALASVLAHELTHARQVHAGDGGKADCVRMEAEAFWTQTRVWAGFWTDQEPPTRTALERELTGLVQVAASEGEPGIYRLVVDTPSYQSQCDLWVPESAPAPSAPSAPDPALMSRCVTLAGDLAESISRDLPPGSAGGARTFPAFLSLCRDAVRRHGARGFTCFETAWKRAIRLNRLVEPGSTAAVRAAQAEYALCVGAR